MRREKLEFWLSKILAERRKYQPQTKAEDTLYEMAEYLLNRTKSKTKKAA